MTLLVLLAVMTPYMIIPWWAWSLAWGRVIFTVVILVLAERKKRALAKVGEEFMQGMIAGLDKAPLPNPMYGMGPKQSIN